MSRKVSFAIALGRYVIANQFTFVAVVPPVEVGQIYATVCRYNDVGQEVLSYLFLCEGRNILLVITDLHRDLFLGNWFRQYRLDRQHALVAEGGGGKGAISLVQFPPKRDVVGTRIVEILVKTISPFARRKVQELEV